MSLPLHCEPDMLRSHGHMLNCMAYHGVVCSKSFAVQAVLSLQWFAKRSLQMSEDLQLRQRSFRHSARRSLSLCGPWNRFCTLFARLSNVYSSIGLQGVASLALQWTTLCVDDFHFFSSMDGFSVSIAMRATSYLIEIKNAESWTPGMLSRGVPSGCLCSRSAEQGTALLSW